MCNRGPGILLPCMGPFPNESTKRCLKCTGPPWLSPRTAVEPAGGTDTKVDAAISLKIPVVVVKRKGIIGEFEYGWEEIVKILRDTFPLYYK